MDTPSEDVISRLSQRLRAVSLSTSTPSLVKSVAPSDISVDNDVVMAEMDIDIPDASDLSDKSELDTLDITKALVVSQPPPLALASPPESSRLSSPSAAIALPAATNTAPHGDSPVDSTGMRRRRRPYSFILLCCAILQSVFLDVLLSFGAHTWQSQALRAVLAVRILRRLPSFQEPPHAPMRRGRVGKKGALPPAAAVRVRAYGGIYGEAAVGFVRLCMLVFCVGEAMGISWKVVVAKQRLLAARCGSFEDLLAVVEQTDKAVRRFVLISSVRANSEKYCLAFLCVSVLLCLPISGRQWHHGRW